MAGTVWITARSPPPELSHRACSAAGDRLPVPLYIACRVTHRLVDLASPVFPAPFVRGRSHSPKQSHPNVSIFLYSAAFHEAGERDGNVVMRITRDVGRMGFRAGVVLAAGLWLAACGGTTATTAPTSPAGSPASSPASPSAGVTTPASSAGSPPSSAPVTAPASARATPIASAEPTPAPTFVPPPSSPTPAPSKGPASGTLAGKGSKGLTAPITVGSVTCQLPYPDGFQIFVLGTFGTNGPGLNMHITATSLAIDVDSGAGATFHSRSFTGTGVTGFDAATGVQIDSQLTEVTASSANTGGIGKLTSLSGSIDCGNQTPGSSSLILTGTTPEGDVNGPIDPVRVGCNNSKQYGRNAQAFGVINVGTTPVTAIVNVNYRGFTVFLSGPGISHFYNSPDATTSSASDTGAEIDGDAVTTAATGVPSITIHVTGSDVCGTSTSGA